MSKGRDSGFGSRDSEKQVQQPGHMHDGEVIRAEGLAKTYAEGKLRTPVFDGLDLAVQAGETVAIVGASGAGRARCCICSAASTRRPRVKCMWRGNG